jgi:hypothetical protein
MFDNFLDNLCERLGNMSDTDATAAYEAYEKEPQRGLLEYAVYHFIVVNFTTAKCEQHSKLPYHEYCSRKVDAIYRNRIAAARSSRLSNELGQSLLSRSDDKRKLKV